MEGADVLGAGVLSAVGPSVGLPVVTRGSEGAIVGEVVVVSAVGGGDGARLGASLAAIAVGDSVVAVAVGDSVVAVAVGDSVVAVAVGDSVVAVAVGDSVVAAAVCDSDGDAVGLLVAIELGPGVIVGDGVWKVLKLLQTQGNPAL